MTWQQKHIILLEIIFDQFLLTHPWLSVPAQSHAKVKNQLHCQKCNKDGFL